MKIEESKRLILQKWESWKKDPNNGTYNEMLNFYNWIEDNHLDLLNFRVPSGTERWQYVHGWLNERIRNSNKKQKNSTCGSRRSWAIEHAADPHR